MIVSFPRPLRFDMFWSIFAVMPANTRVREPTGDRIRKQCTEDPQKVDILGPQPITNGPSTMRWWPLISISPTTSVQTDSRSSVAVVEPTQGW